MEATFQSHIGLLDLLLPSYRKLSTRDLRIFAAGDEVETVYIRHRILQLNYSPLVLSEATFADYYLEWYSSHG